MKFIISLCLQILGYICVGLVMPDADMKSWIIMIFAVVLFEISGIISTF